MSIFVPIFSPNACAHEAHTAMVEAAAATTAVVEVFVCSLKGYG